MQVAIFQILHGDIIATEELNRFLRTHRVLTLDRAAVPGGWSFCVTHLPAVVGASSHGKPDTAKVDYKQTLDGPTFALFSKLREIRKTLAEAEGAPPYAVFTNEQLALIAGTRCDSKAALEKIPGVGSARVAKYADTILAAVLHHAQQPDPTRSDSAPGQPA